VSPAVRTRALRIGIAVAIVGAVLWWFHHRSEPGAASAQAAQQGQGNGSASGGRVVPVQIARAVRRDLPIWLEGLGTVAPVQQVTVRAQVDGRLDRVLFKEGQAVKRGDVLAQIDPRPFTVQLHQAQGALARDRASYETAKKNYERYKELHEQQLVAMQQVEQYQAQMGEAAGAMKIDEAQVEAAQLQLDYAQVKSPLDGVTGVRQVDAGNLVHSSDPNGIVVIAAIDPAAVVFTLPQDRLAQVAAAQAKGEVKVEVWNRDGSQKIAEGALSVIDNQINQTTATLRMKALVPNPNRALWPNAFVKTRILVETREHALVVPSVAVQHGPQGTFVYIVGHDTTAEMKPVTVALDSGDVTVIEKGISEGDQVVVEGQNQLRPGSKVAAPVAKTGHERM
jgi:multidrug efflux system membrane fusion protein